MPEIPAGFDPKFADTVMFKLALAAYAAETTATPALPDGFRQTALIEADLTQIEALANGIDPLERLVERLRGDTMVYGVVGNDGGKIAFVALRGTLTPREWEGNVFAIPVPYEPVPNFGRVHAGFKLVYKAIRASLAAELEAAAVGCTRILVTGHSLGGALATLAAPDIARNMLPGRTPELITFASPRTGCDDYASVFNPLIPICFRVVNPADVVPNIPEPVRFLFPYKHVGIEVKLGERFLGDVIRAHSLDDSYGPGLAALLD